MTHSRDRSPEGRDSEAGSMRSTRARSAPNPDSNPLIGKGEVVQADEIERCIDAADRVYPERSHSAENDAFQQGWLAAHNHRLTAQPVTVASPGYEAELLTKIAEMMSAHVENWPNPKKVSTAISLIDKTLHAAITTKPGYEAGLAEGRRKLMELREKASRPKALGKWRVHDSHFFKWLAENVGPENVEYLRFLWLNAEAIFIDSTEGRREVEHLSWQPRIGDEVRVAEHITAQWPEFRGEERFWVVGVAFGRSTGGYPVPGLNITVSDEWPVTSRTGGFTDGFYIDRPFTPDDLVPVSRPTTEGESGDA